MNLTNNKIMVGVAVGLCILFIPLSNFIKSDPIEILSEVESQTLKVENDGKSIYVQVSGAVLKPGIYQMSSEDRMNDALIIAEAANYNPECINLAQKLVDEQNIYVPKSGEKCLNVDSIDQNGVVNINTANVYELQTISGIGESKAKKIIEYRNNNGTFQDKNELLEVEGISEKLLLSVSELITLS